MPLPGNEEKVGEGILVSFHNHSDQGKPFVATAHGNTNNRWEFHERGWAAEDIGFLEALVPLKPEGLYIITEHVHVTREEIIPPKTLLQLGYNRSADTILFVARFEENVIKFASSGYAFPSPEVQSLLEPAGFNIPQPRPEEKLH
jgi:hypothetical protein